ncbi:MAG TPA: hypothetical protein VJ884_06870 [Salinibacter sp.]|nr:hypothetical protein [Salinibacter sp.]
MRSGSAVSHFLFGGMLVLGLLAGLAGCASEERPPGATSSPSTPDTTVADDVIQGTGTIRYVDLEGGFYGIVAEDGTKYDPTPLPDSLQEDGLSVRFQLKEKDVLTTRMWGTPVEVIRIERTRTARD